MSLAPGQDLLHYRLVEKIGEGGMGFVWHARDTTLDRDVAIKFLPEHLASDPERLARFEREAKLLAALDHPNIASVYGLHEHEGRTFIAMEFVPGEDLAARLARGPLPLDDTLDVARQVAAALESAHEHGIVHRDLKPANVKITPDGRVKVLDLGLAKALVAESSHDAPSVSLSPTVTSAGTIAGTLLGTAAYMSPEQAKGRTVDRRADIWAFGVVLHEMLTGNKLFETETISETLAAVLRDDVSFDGMPAVPPAVMHLLERCLDRDPNTRLRDIGEARIALAPENLTRAESGHGAAAPDSRRGRVPIPWVVATAVLAVVAVVAVVGLTVRGDAAGSFPEVRAAILPPEGARFGSHNVTALSISPDGTKVLLAASTGSGRPSLYLRAIGSSEARILPGTDGASYPFWSPDSRWIAFFADAKLKKLDLEGGAPLTVAQASDARGGTWNADGTILFAASTQEPISRVTDGGAMGEPVTTLDADRKGETSHRFPWFLPDGRHFLFLRASHAAAAADDVNSIWVGSLDSDETVELMTSETQAVYAQGHLFFVRDRFLMARPFSVDELAFTGDAFAVGEGVVSFVGAWRAAFAVSEAGPIVFHGGAALEQQLRIFDRGGKVQRTIGDPANVTFIRLSPDDRRLAATVADPSTGRADLWIHDIERDVASRLTFHDAQDTNPVWSPDGERIAFTSSRNGGSDIFVRRADGTGDVELLFEGGGRAEVEDWSRDGRYIAFDHGVGKGDLSILSLETGEATPLVATEFDDGYARFSPDGNWIAYISNQSGRYESYLTRFPGGEGKWQLTSGGSDWLLGWNDAGTELYHLDTDGYVAVIRVRLGNQVVVDPPETLFPVSAGQTWDASSDGEWFVFGTSGTTDAEDPVTLILNWRPRDD